MMFGRDFPHPESTWPNTWDWLRDAFSGVPEDDVRAIVGENALTCYRIDPHSDAGDCRSDRTPD